MGAAGRQSRTDGKAASVELARAQNHYGELVAFIQGPARKAHRAESPTNTFRQPLCISDRKNQ